MLMDQSAVNAKVDFTVADPAWVLYNFPYPSIRPIVLGGLVTNTAFWAIDRRSKKILGLSDLAAFDKIIAFDRGTTSYGIASRILRGVGEKDLRSRVLRVKPGTELDALVESATGTMALSPNILNIDILLSNYPEFNIDLALASTTEYSNILITALMTRSDVIERDEPLVRNLLRAVQRALSLVRLRSADVIEYANIRFQGSGEDPIIGALDK